MVNWGEDRQFIMFAPTEPKRKETELFSINMQLEKYNGETKEKRIQLKCLPTAIVKMKWICVISKIEECFVVMTIHVT